MVKCLLCGREMRLITHSHLKYDHDMSTTDYLTRFPGAVMRDDNFVKDPKAWKNAIQETFNKMTPEEKESISDTLSKSHMGIYPSAETRSKRSETSLRVLGTSEYREEQSKRMSPVMEEVWKRPEYRAKMTTIFTERNRQQWQDPEYREKTLRAQRALPSEEERLITAILDEHFSGEWTYTGNKPFAEGSRKPDWTHTSRRLVICYNHSYWHLIVRDDLPSASVEHYKKLGYECLVLNEKDLWVGGPDLIVSKVKELSTK